jgi:Putative peptidoglycan binding domain
MKTKMLLAAFVASVALVAPVQGGQHGGGGGGGGGFAAGHAGMARGGGGPSFHSMPAGRFGGGASLRSMPMRSFSSNRMIYSGQRFSSVGGFRSPNEAQFHPRGINSNVGGSFAGRQFTRGNFNRSNNLQRFSNAGNQRVGNGQFRNGTNQVRNGNQRLRSDWRNHVFAQHSANWHRDWDRDRDHFFHGHRFIFFDGFWWGFDFGFDPWWPWWWDYPYYGYGYGYGYPYPYSYGYDPGSYDSSSYYNDDGGYADQSGNSTVVAVQQRLAREGYYRGQIDGVFGPDTRAALADYQSNHGLRVTGTLSTETLASLGVRRVASY